jgi:hypothetical protein
MVTLLSVLMWRRTSVSDANAVLLGAEVTFSMDNDGGERSRAKATSSQKNDWSHLHKI